ncbi:MAG: hypothetical protein LBH54_04890 [Clostridiales bacterium]|jgi:hypothetical protein|nr:hypothetical protein [Clostridiales bacterium]
MDKGKLDKKWFENYWYYYKFHTIAGIFALFIAAVTLVECATNVKTDATVTYIGGAYFDQTFSDGFESEMSQYIDDVNGDGVNKIFFSLLTLSEEVTSEQDIAMQQKAQLEIAVGETYLFLMDEGYYRLYQEQNLFEDAARHVGADEPLYGFAVNNSDFLKNLGFAPKSTVYAAVRVLTSGDEKKPQKVAQQNNAFKMLTRLYAGTDARME